jgi:CBS domain-containing protein
MPVLEPYPSLGTLRVVDAMHPRLISCDPEAQLRSVARMMATYRVHAILVKEHGDESLPGGGVCGVVTDTDLLRSAETGDLDERTARSIASAPVPTVTTDQPLASAAEVMLEHGASHLVVVEPHSALPIGVLSTLDIAAALARFPETHPVQPTTATVA